MLRLCFSLLGGILWSIFVLFCRRFSGKQDALKAYILGTHDLMVFIYLIIEFIILAYQRWCWVGIVSSPSLRSDAFTRWVKIPVTQWIGYIRYFNDFYKYIQVCSNITLELLNCTWFFNRKPLNFNFQILFYDHTWCCQIGLEDNSSSFAYHMCPE